MGLSSAIQFKNKEAVLIAFENRDVDAWSLWQNKQFMFKGTGAAQLSEILNMLSNGGTNAVYTLKVYEDITDEKKIKSNTADDGSFNFRLNSDTQEILHGQYATVYSNEALIKRIDEMEEKFHDEPETNNLGSLGSLLMHPVLAPMIPMLVEKISTFLLGGKAPAPAEMPAPVLMPNPAMNLGNINDDQIIADAIKKLKLHDPDLAIHLTKLVEVAETQPQIFKALINSLV